MAVKARDDDADIRETLHRHDAQLTSLTNDLSSMKGVLREHSQILNDIRTTLSGLQARTPRDFRENLGAVKDVLLLIGILVGSVLFIADGQIGKSVGDAKSTIARQVTILEESSKAQAAALQRIEEQIGWTPRVEKSR